MKIKIITICLYFFIPFNIVKSQSYSNVRIDQDGLSINILYDMNGKLNRGDKVALTYSVDNGNNYFFIDDANGDIGSNILAGKNNEIQWSVVDKNYIIDNVIRFRIVTIPKGMVYVDGGGFSRSAFTKNNNLKEYSVQISSFLMDQTEVTQREYRQVMGENASDYAGCMDCPVENISWFDAVTYAKKVGKRLPTEAEWEFAANGGTYSNNSLKFSGSNNINKVAWYLKNTKAKQPVGQKVPNKLGLYDMTGNVWEWCSDWYDQGYYQISPELNPTGPKFGIEKVVRGGSWLSNSDFCKTTKRYKLKPDYRDINFGFRCVKDL